MITTLQPVEVHIYWGRIKPLIDKALKHELYEADDMKESCLKGLTRVYLVNDFEAICTVELKNYPKARIAVIHTLGGSNMNKWVNKLLDQIIKDSKNAGATQVQINGRRGWLKRLNGFKETHTTMTRAI